MANPNRFPNRPPSRSRSARRWLLGLALGLGLGAPAHAQITPANARRVDADQRRAQREARRTPAPYKDTHLDVARTRLQRGDGDHPHPDGADALRYRNGAPAPARPKKGLLGLGRKKH